MYKFLSSYVGSKSYWVPKLEKYRGRDFVELFCGSAVISANLAKTAVLNDIDPYIHKILSRFDEQIVPDEFTPDDYFSVRGMKDWWKYAYCLSKMSFSGVFRYSKNGFNVPIKVDTPISILPEYKSSLSRWIELSPLCLNNDYWNNNELINKESVLILDPPYEGTKASYNKTNFDYHLYWEYVRLNEDICKTVIVFDFINNLPFGAMETKKSRVNGKHKGNIEGIFVFEDSFKSGFRGEQEFYSKYKDRLVWINKAHEPDFQLIESGRFVELKSDYYDMDKTENFFIERYSDCSKYTPGGPWQALEKNAFYYVYYFPKNNIHFIFETKKLVDFLNKTRDTWRMEKIRNKSWTTSGFVVPRDKLQHLYKEISK